MIEIVLSYSVLAEWRRCPTAFRYRYVDSLVRPAISDIQAGSPLLFGSLVHKFLENYHGSDADYSSLLADILNEAATSQLVHVEPGKIRSILHLERLLCAYVAKYERSAEFTPLWSDKKSFEVEVDFPLWQGDVGYTNSAGDYVSNSVKIIWRQHYDGLVKYEGKPTILEHKTSSGDLRRDLMERMLPNAQAIGYAYGAIKHLGLDVSGILFNGLCTYRPLVNPGYAPRSGEAQPLFLRHLVRVEPWMLDEWKAQVTKDSIRLVEDVLSNSYTNNAPDSCTVFNTRCKFADLCKVDPASREIVKDAGYQVEAWKGWNFKNET